MKILITGICGFVGSTLARAYRENFPQVEIWGIDNFSRPGAWLNKEPLKRLGVTLQHGDLRAISDLESLPAVDWVIDAAANPSVLAGVDGRSSSRQLVEHNLAGTINLLEYCKRVQAGFILLSTSRVYSIEPLAGLPVEIVRREPGERFAPQGGDLGILGISESGVAENFSTLPPVSLYGSTKVASEHLALEYGATFEFPVWINRCGVMAGAGQFGHPAQGIFAYWVHSFRERRPLRYIGFGGRGHQVRDVLHPRDLLPLFERQMAAGLATHLPRTINVSGGLASSMSLNEMSNWCAQQFRPMDILEIEEGRRFDIPWMVLDSALAKEVWDWSPTTSNHAILAEIADFAEKHPDWLDVAV